MLRFVNAHRVACVGLVAALVLVIVMMATRVGTEPDPADSEPMQTVEHCRLTDTGGSRHPQRRLDAATQRPGGR